MTSPSDSLDFLVNGKAAPIGTGEAARLLELSSTAGVRYLISIGVLPVESRLSGRILLDRDTVIALAVARAIERATAAEAFAEARQQP